MPPDQSYKKPKTIHNQIKKTSNKKTIEESENEMKDEALAANGNAIRYKKTATSSSALITQHQRL